MQNNRFFTLLFTLLVCTPVLAQPRHSISKIVGRNSINEADASKIEQYAQGWAEALFTTDAMGLYEAQRHLIEPLEPEIAMSPYARSLYGKAIKNGLAPILDENNTNEMAAVNALQVISLLGTEQGCGILLRHADSSSEERAALRHWASIGIGKSFAQGMLPNRRIASIANTLADYASREMVWYIIARQFNALATIQQIPDLDSSQQDELETLSFELQIRALSELLTEIAKGEVANDRVRALPFILSSLRLQLIEPGVNEAARKAADKEIVPLLTSFVDVAINHAASSTENPALHDAYGEAIQSSGFIVERVLKLDHDGSYLLELWKSNNTAEISTRLNAWKNAQ